MCSSFNPVLWVTVNFAGLSCFLTSPKLEGFFQGLWLLVKIAFYVFLTPSLTPKVLEFLVSAHWLS